MDLQKKYVKLYEELYNEMVEEGLSPDDAQKLAYKKVEHVKKIIESTLEELDNDSWYCSLRMTIPLKAVPNWNKLSYTEKELLLYNKGVDIRLPWRVKEGYHVVNGRKEFGKYIECSERTDKEWTSSSNASFEAIMEGERIRRGEDHFWDMKRMSRQYVS